jgi:hypothetical protein
VVVVVSLVEGVTIGGVSVVLPGPPIAPLLVEAGPPVPVVPAVSLLVVPGGVVSAVPLVVVSVVPVPLDVAVSLLGAGVMVVLLEVAVSAGGAGVVVVDVLVDVEASSRWVQAPSETAATSASAAPRLRDAFMGKLLCSKVARAANHCPIGTLGTPGAEFVGSRRRCV